MSFCIENIKMHNTYLKFQIYTDFIPKPRKKKKKLK